MDNDDPNFTVRLACWQVVAGIHVLLWQRPVAELPKIYVDQIEL